ncbi:MAG: hypothetical protein RL398_1673 [Planctomycetota bacterium]|jgi:hypothetical protein
MRATVPTLVMATLCGLLAAQGDASKARKVDFASQVYPIFEKRCVECHASPTTENGRTKKPKGGVILDSKAGILAGKRGKLVVAGDADGSTLVETICLPADDEDRMPPPDKGAPLSKDQIELIKAWIAGGADFGKWTGKAAAEPTPAAASSGNAAKASSAKAKAKDQVTEILGSLPTLADDKLADFADGPFVVHRFEPGSPMLVVTAAGHTDEVDDAAVSKLLPIAAHIVDLDLGRTKVGDGCLPTIAKFGNLLRLDLRQTTVANGVTALAACKRLESINLFGTPVGDYGMAAFASLKNLRAVYVWQTEVTAAAAMRLREAVPGVRVVVGADLPEPMTDAPATGGRRR